MNFKIHLSFLILLIDFLINEIINHLNLTLNLN